MKSIGSTLQIRGFKPIGKQHIGDGNICIHQRLNTVIESGQLVGIKRHQQIVQAAGQNGAGPVDDGILEEELEF